MLRLSAALCLALSPTLILLQDGPAPAQEAAPKVEFVAAPEDVESPDAILAALYDVISGPKGHERNWDRFRSLFHSSARLSPIVRDRAAQRFDIGEYTPDQYIEMSNNFLFENGFFETEVARRFEKFGSLAHAWSTYESRHTGDEPEPTQRGINSIQLLDDGSRWWVLSVLWQAETPVLKLPEEYAGEK